MNLRTIQVTLEDKPGALMRAIGVITAMGANIHSLALRPDDAIEGRSLLTLSAELTPRQLDLALRKLNTLIQVFDARELPSCGGADVHPCHNCSEIASPWTNPRV